MVKKTMGGKQYPSKAFLVVVDSDAPSTWHLRVRDVEGKVNRRLLGAAWAALHGGYRGNKYEGPKKAEAVRKLKALYKAEDMEVPSAEVAAEAGESFLYTDEEPALPSDYVPWGVTSFQDIRVYNQADRATREVVVLSHQLQRLIDNVMSEDEIENKTAAIRTVADEFVELVAEALGEVTEAAESEELVELDVRESAGAVLAYADLEEADSNGGIATLDLVIIEPGWGNKRDNRFYSKDMLEKNAGVFVGAKQYETDHRQGEKSNHTWVSTIKEIVGFSETGAPIGRAVAHDPGFAERVRNLNEAGLLGEMNSSVLAKAMAQSGTVNGKKGMIVGEICADPKPDVDWVTRAGAGGHALRLVENEEGVEDMKDKEKEDAEGTEETTENEVVEESEETVVEIQETETDSVEEETPEESLDEKRVVSILAETNLPESAKTYLAESKYKTEEVLKEAVTKHIEYLKAVTGSGKPFGHEGGATEVAMEEKQYDERYAAIMESHGVRQFGGN